MFVLYARLLKSVQRCTTWYNAGCFSTETMPAEICVVSLQHTVRLLMTHPFFSFFLESLSIGRFRKAHLVAFLCIWPCFVSYRFHLCVTWFGRYVIATLSHWALFSVCYRMWFPTSWTPTLVYTAYLCQFIHLLPSFTAAMCSLFCRYSTLWKENELQNCCQYSHSSTAWNNVAYQRPNTPLLLAI